MRAMSHSTISAKVGKPFEVSLPFNPGAGYQWEPAVDAEQVTLVDKSTEAPSAGIGGQAVQKFVFQPVAAGSAQLKFLLKRRWESAAADTKIVDVEIKA
jgi:predicted secreted protein